MKTFFLFSTDDYRELTPFQYASGEPIGNVDADGLEGASVNAGQVLDEGAQAASQVGVDVSPLATAWVSPAASQTARRAAAFAVSKAAQYTGRLAVIAFRGSLDAVANANTLGAYDFFTSVLSHEPVDDYSDPAEKEAYYTGRLAGNAAMIFQATDEIAGGTGGGLAAAVPLGGLSLIGGGVVALHGLGVGATAIHDAINIVKQLYILRSEGGMRRISLRMPKASL